MKKTRVCMLVAVCIGLGLMSACGQPSVPGEAGTIMKSGHSRSDQPAEPSTSPSDAAVEAAKGAVERDASEAANAARASGTPSSLPRRPPGH